VAQCRVSIRAATTNDVLGLLVRAVSLTPRERELVTLLADGLDTRQLSHRLCISRYTVQQHLKSVFGKVGVRSRRELLTGVLAAHSARPEYLCIAVYMENAR